MNGDTNVGPYTLTVQDGRMYPVCEPGDKLEVSPSWPLREQVDVVLHSADSTRRRVVRIESWTDDEWTVSEHNPARTFRLSRKHWPVAHRISCFINADLDQMTTGDGGGADTVPGSTGGRHR
jgi:hypothetical protein